MLNELKQEDLWSDIGGMFQHKSYRRAVEIFNRLNNPLDLYGDQIGIIAGQERQYWKWVKNPHTVYVIERYKTDGADTHSILLTSSFQTIYNPAPEKRLLGVESALLYFVGPFSEWERLIGYD